MKGFEIMNIFTVFSDIKTFFSNTMNTVCVLLLLACMTNLGFQIKLNYEINVLAKKIELLTQNSETKINKSKQEIINEIKINRDKIHFRYFNLTHSIEDVHGVKINTKNGKIER